MHGRHTVVPIPIVIAILLALASFYLFLPPHRAYVQIRDYMWQKRESKRMAEGRKRRQESRKLKEKEARERLERLRAPVRGYVDSALVDSAFFELVAIVSRESRAMLWRYKDGNALHRKCRGDREDTSTDSSLGFEMMDEERTLLLDIMNIIIRDGLVDQKDEREFAYDGGELTFKFVFGTNNGQFRLINMFDPPHLESFLFKVNELKDLTSNSHPKSECPPWVYIPRKQTHHTTVPRPTIPVEGP